MNATPQRVREDVARVSHLRHVDDAGGDAFAEQELRQLIGEIVAVVCEQVVGLAREAWRDLLEKVLEHLLRHGRAAQRQDFARLQTERGLDGGGRQGLHPAAEEVLHTVDLHSGMRDQVELLAGQLRAAPHARTHTPTQVSPAAARQTICTLQLDRGAATNPKRNP